MNPGSMAGGNPMSPMELQNKKMSSMIGMNSRVTKTDNKGPKNLYSLLEANISDIDIVVDDNINNYEENKSVAHPKQDED